MLCVSREVARRATPQELINAIKERSVSAKRRQCLEEERALALVVAKYVWWETLDRAVTVEQLRGRDRPDTSDPRISISGVADEGKKVRNQTRHDAELLANTIGVADLSAAPIDLYDAETYQYLRTITIEGDQTTELFVLPSPPS